MSEKKQKTLPSVHSSPLDGWTSVSPMLSVGFVLTVLVATILAVCGLYRYSGEQDERIAALEGQMKTYSDAFALSGSELEPLRSRLAETEKQLKSVTERLTLLEQRPVLTEEEYARTGQMAASLASLQATLAQQGETLRAYDLRLEKLEKTPFTPVSPSSAKGTGTVKSTPAVTPRQKKGSSGVSVISRSAPFVLTGTEQRGGRTYAAVAPRGFTRLSDVTLLGEGESTAGWMLERAGRGEASFRVNGRQVRVMVE